MAGNTGPNIITDGLVYYLDAANKQSYSGTGTIWNDLIQNYELTLNNNPSFSNLNNGIITFNGSNQYGSATSNIAPNIENNLTINFWVSGGTSPLNGTIIEKGTNFGSKMFFTLGIWRVQLGFGTQLINTNITYTGNTWYNFTGTWSRSAPNTWLTLYLNGYQINSEPYAGRVTSDNADLYIGGTLSGGNLNCNLSHISIYNRNLLPPEILQNYNATKSRFGL